MRNGMSEFGQKLQNGGAPLNARSVTIIMNIT